MRIERATTALRAPGRAPCTVQGAASSTGRGRPYNPLARRRVKFIAMASPICTTSRLTVNGEPLEVPGGSTVADLLSSMDTAGRRVAVERNGEIVPRSAHGSTVLAPGDRLEIVVAVGGG
jgi:sulfur carrier protein